MTLPESTIESLSIQDLCEMYAQAREQVASAMTDIATAPYADRAADVQARRQSGEQRRAGGQRAMDVVLEELGRRSSDANSGGAAA